MFATVRQNSTQRFFVALVNNSYAPMSGLTPATITVRLAKQGGTSNLVTITMIERQQGIYEITPLAAHRDTLGESIWEFKPNASDYRSLRQERVMATDIDELLRVPRAASALPAGTYRMQVGTGQAANINITPPS